MHALFVLWMALAAGAAPVAGAAGPPTKSAMERWGLAFSVGEEVRHDDNILQMSDQDIQKLANNPSSTRFQISSPDDWVAHTEFDARWAHRIFSRRQTRFSAGVDLYRFRTNGIKNWNGYHLGLTQELTASRRHLLLLRLGADWISDYYLRELTDDDASFAAGFRIRRSARYDQATPSASLGWELIDDRLTMSLGYEHARRSYVHFFNERDGVRTDWSLEARVRPVKRWRFEFTLGGATGAYAARGDLASTPIPDDDISYDHDGAWLKAAIPWGDKRRGRVEAEIQTERRDYTTGNQFDLFHSRRTDRRRENGLRVVQRMGHRLDLSAEWRHTSNDASFAPGVIPHDDVTDYTNDRFSVGLRARFGSQ